MMIAYINSDGKRIDLQSKYIKISTANFHKFEFSWNGIGKVYGEEVSEFKKAAYELPMKLLFYGSENRRERNLEEFYELTAVDRERKTPGKLIWGKWYVKAYVMSENVYPGKDGETVNEIVLKAPFPFWIQEKRIVFPKFNGTSFEGLNYPYDYPYEYSGVTKGQASFVNDDYTETHFQMIIYGPAVNPLILIGDNVYEVRANVLENEYLTIDSIEKTIIRTTREGIHINEFNNRGLRKSVFEKIPIGKQMVSWSGDYGIDLIMFARRSVPKWN